MYEDYFGLSGPPFKLNPDPKFFFGSRSHNKAMAYLHYGLKQAEGFIVITGPVGAGKSMVIGHLLDQLDRSNIVAVQLLTSNVEPDELLEHVLSAFRIEPEGEGRTGQLEAFEDYLFDQLHRGKRVLLIMDEAQNLPHKTLEELRMLSNLDYDGTPLFQVFLVGQPEFRNTLLSAEMEQLKQRVIASYHLENLSREETREYILHRLSVVGWRQDPVFDEEIFDTVYAETEGRPRRINTICNRLMLYCALEHVHEVTCSVVATVVAELHEEKLGSTNADTSTETVAPPSVKSKNSIAEARTTNIADSVEVSVTAPSGKKEIKKAQTPSEVVASSETGSVFDRLRAKKNDESEPSPEEDRFEATLTDVASAIAAAAAAADSEGVSDDAPDSSERVGASVKDESDAEVAILDRERHAVLRSIDDAREDLKQIHAGIRRFRSEHDANNKRRHIRRMQVVESLSKAEELVESLRRVGS